MRAVGLVLLLPWLAPGCLSWSPPVGDDDDSAPGDDDDTVGDDDDVTGDDDDDTTEPLALSVDQAAQGAITVVRFSEIEREQAQALAAMVLSNTLLTPSADEAAYEDAIGYPVLTSGQPGDMVDVTLPPGQYEGDYLLLEESVYLGVGADSFEVPRQGSGWATTEGLDLSGLSVGGTWTLRVPDGLPFAGFQEGPPLPGRPELSSDRLVGGQLFVHAGSSFTLAATTLGSTDEPDVFAVISSDGADARARAWPLVAGTGLSLAADKLAPFGTEAQFFYQRSARSRVEGDGGALLLTTAQVA